MRGNSGKSHVTTHNLFRAFQHFDTNNNGALDADELAAILSNPSGNRPCSPEEALRMAQEVIAKYSNGQESVLHFKEFIHYWSERDKEIADKLLAKALRAEADAEAKAAACLAEASAEERELGEAGKAVLDLELLEARMGTLQAAFDKEVREPGPDAASKGKLLKKLRGSMEHLDASIKDAARHASEHAVHATEEHHRLVEARNAAVKAIEHATHIGKRAVRAAGEAHDMAFKVTQVDDSAATDEALRASVRTVEEVEEVLRKDAELMAQVRATEEGAAGSRSANAKGKSGGLDAEGVATGSAVEEHVWHHLSEVDRKQLGAGAHEALVRLADAVHKADFYTRSVRDAARQLCAVQVDRALIDDAVAKHAAVGKTPPPKTSLLEQAMMGDQTEGKESHYADITISADLRAAQ